MSDGVRRRAGASTGVATNAATADPAVKLDMNEEVKPGAGACLMRAGLTLLPVLRLLAACIAMIADCDETFNYWEPMHFVAFGRGFQTWEYSPEFALRSYLFLLPHAVAAKLFAFGARRQLVFFLTRGTQAMVAVVAETTFVTTVRRRFGPEIAGTTAVLLATSPGMWSAAVAFLPSSIAMLLVCGVWSLWLSRRLGAAIFLGMGTVVVVWPFTGFLFVPLGLHALWALGSLRAISTALVSFFFWALASLLVDSYFYGRAVLPALQILRYNVRSAGGGAGSELYGVEPWHFYLLNGTLNLTLALHAAIALPVVMLVSRCPPCASRSSTIARGCGPATALGFCLAGLLWLAFFSCIPHKEERFLAPAYPVLILAAACSLHGAVDMLSQVFAKARVHFIPKLLNVVPILFLVATVLLSMSRIAMLQIGYAAPLAVYSALSEELANTRVGAAPRHVCVGTEWYRFTTSFFLPHAEDHLSYVRFGATGLLPAEWNYTLGTASIPPHMNDQNKEEPSRYMDPSSCDYFVDLPMGEGEADVVDLRTQAWEVVAEAPFLDASRSRQPWRSFHVPGFSTQRNVYAQYRLLKRPSKRTP